MRPVIRAVSYTHLDVYKRQDSNCVPGIERAQEAGIPVIPVWVEFKDDPYVNICVGSNAYAEGQAAAEYFAEKIGDEGGQVAVITGIASNPITPERTNGFSEYFEKNDLNIEVVDVQNGDWDRSKAKDVADTMLKAYPDLKGIYCNNDTMAMGVVEAVRGCLLYTSSRLSFLQGNYITLTNMTEKDVERIIHMQLAPINISVQSTNPELRCKMLHNRFAGDKLKYLDQLYEGHVEMNGQIVCCKGVNDGEELRRSIEDLSKYLPFMRSVSAVPAGITKYRDGLYPLELYTKEEAEAVIDLIESYQKKFYEEYGLHFIHASDEWYITAERDFPEEELSLIHI